MSFYDYAPYDKNLFQQRKKDLEEQAFDRDRLADVLITLNKKWNGDEATFHNIDRLKQKNSLVVIGGQQAGLLTGPMLSIHKIISILSLSKQQEELLRVPVIPVFWIAGEDHDYDEINHVYLPAKEKLVKHVYQTREHRKLSISHRQLDKEQLKSWVIEAFQYLEETEYTKDVYHTVDRLIGESNNLVDLFAKIIHWLCKGTGIVLIDSGNDLVRELESSFFIEMIQNQKDISQSVYRTMESLQAKGYSVAVDVEEDDAHLFYHLQGERILLKRRGNDWVGKNEECILSTEQLLEIAKHHPEQLSNNVITRPLMQEKLFPTLAFFGGMSEVAYWSLLKDAFHSLDMKMPPVLPRNSFTWVERKITKYLNRYGIKLESAIAGEVDQYKMNWLKAQMTPPLDTMIEEFQQTIRTAHRPFHDIAKEWRSDIADYTENNLQFLLQHTEELRKQFNRELEKDHSKAIHEFDQIQLHLYPNGGFQERSWNIFYFINYYGVEFIRTIMNKNYRYDQLHYLIGL